MSKAIGVPFSAVYMAASTPFAVPSGRRTGTAEYYEKDAARRRRLFHLEKGIRKRRPVGRRFLLQLFRKIVLEQGVFDHVPVFVEELDGAGFTAVLNIDDGSFRAGLDAGFRIVFPKDDDVI